MSATEGNSTMNVEDTVKDFWATRPRRPRSGRVVAGVAAGIGRRYGIDPVIVRVVLVVSAIYGGAGILAYLLGWLFLAAEDDEVSPFEAMIGRGRSTMSRGLTIVLCIALIPAANFAVFGGHFSTAAGVVVLAGALYLLHRSRGHLGHVDAAAPTTTSTVGGTMTDDGPTDRVPTDQPVEDAIPTTRTEPPAWDPLGAAPFAWDLPDPTPATPAPAPAPVPRRRRSRTGLAVLGLVFVTGATLIALSGSGSWLSGAHIAGLLTAITGVGLIVSSFLHGGRGLITLAVILAAAGFALTETHYDGWHGAGDTHFRPTQISQVRPLYDQSAGNIRLDLTGLPATGHVQTKLNLGVGNMTVIVPQGAEVHATCAVSLGQVDCLGQRDSGAGNPTVTAVQQAAPG
ncbi:MAG TPA: PspC domain-containing protein, partial [Pseudonocardiaceae bacterium]|nr:PspC domain-containing protein [Pseudonocardiaceae bacterium]